MSSSLNKDIIIIVIIIIIIIMVLQMFLETYLSSYQTWFKFITAFGNNEVIFEQTHLDIERNSCVRFRQNSSSRCDNG